MKLTYLVHITFGVLILKTELPQRNATAQISVISHMTTINNNG